MAKQNIPKEVENDSVEERIKHFKTAAFEMLNNGVPAKLLIDSIPGLEESELYEGIIGIQEAVRDFEACKMKVILFSERPFNSVEPLLSEDEYLFRHNCSEFLIKSDVVIKASSDSKVRKSLIIRHYLNLMNEGEFMIFCLGRMEILKKPDFEFTHSFMVQTNNAGDISENVIGIKVCSESKEIINEWYEVNSYSKREITLEEHFWGFEYGIMPEGYFKEREQKKCVS
jgi:hypothetical protein